MLNVWQKQSRLWDKKGNKMKLSLKIIAIILMSLTLLVAAAPKSNVIVLTSANHTAINTDFNGQSVDDAITALSNRDKTKPFYIYLDSPGGEVFAGKRLLDYLSGDSENVTCIAANAMSMAFVTLQACPTRLVTPNAVLMSHGIQGGGQGDIKAIEKNLEIMKKLEALLNKISAERLKITIEELVKRHNPEYWIVGAEEILQANAADGVTSVTCDASLKGKKKIKVATPFGTLDVETNKCPI